MVQDQGVGNYPIRTDILYIRHVVRQSRGGEGPRDFLPSCLRTKRANRSWGRGPVPAEILRSCDNRGERHLWSDTALISIGAHAGSDTERCQSTVRMGMRWFTRLITPFGKRTERGVAQNAIAIALNL